MVLNNPFEKPDPNSDEAKKVIRWVDHMIRTHRGGLRIHDCFQKIEELLDNDKIIQAQAACYYTSNIIIKNRNLSDHDKTEIILGLKQQIDTKIENKIDTKNEMNKNE